MTTKFEYQIAPCPLTSNNRADPWPGNANRLLGDYANDGWEVIQFVGDKGHVLLKREVVTPAVAQGTWA